MVSSVKYYSFKDMSLLARKPFTIFFWSTILLIYHCGRAGDYVLRNFPRVCPIGAGLVGDQI